MVTEPDLVAAEAALGVVLPQDYRDFLQTSDGLEELMPDAYVSLWPLSEVVNIGRSDTYGLAEQVPGLLLIGGDGGGELLGLDLRSDPPRVVLVNAIGASWADASVQANSVSGLITQLRGGGSYSFESSG